MPAETNDISCPDHDTGVIGNKLALLYWDRKSADNCTLFLILFFY